MLRWFTRDNAAKAVQAIDTYKASAAGIEQQALVDGIKLRRELWGLEEDQKDAEDLISEYERIYGKVSEDKDTELVNSIENDLHKSKAESTVRQVQLEALEQALMQLHKVRG